MSLIGKASCLKVVPLPFEAWNFDPTTFTGQSAVAEGVASFYTVFLRTAAKNVSAEIKTGQRRDRVFAGPDTGGGQ